MKQFSTGSSRDELLVDGSMILPVSGWLEWSSSLPVQAEMNSWWMGQWFYLFFTGWNGWLDPWVIRDSRPSSSGQWIWLFLVGWNEAVLYRIDQRWTLDEEVIESDCFWLVGMKQFSTGSSRDELLMKRSLNLTVFHWLEWMIRSMSNQR
jgi:hypothetical protein